MKQFSLQELSQKLETLRLTVEALRTEEREEKWYDTSDIKILFNLSDSTIYRLRKANKIPSEKIGGKVFYPAYYFTKAIIRKIENRGFIKD